MKKKLLFVDKSIINFNVFLGIWVWSNNNKCLILNKFTFCSRHRLLAFSLCYLFWAFILIEKLFNLYDVKKKSLMFVCDNLDYKIQFRNLILDMKQYYLIELIDGIISNNFRLLHPIKKNLNNISRVTNFIYRDELPKFVFILSMSSEVRRKFLLECSRLRLPVFNLVFIENDFFEEETSYYIIGNGCHLQFLDFFIGLIHKLIIEK